MGHEPLSSERAAAACLCDAAAGKKSIRPDAFAFLGFMHSCVDVRSLPGEEPNQVLGCLTLHAG